MRPRLLVLALLMIGLVNAGAANSLIQLLQDSSLPRFLFTSSREAINLAEGALRQIHKSTKATKVVLGITAQHRTVEAYYFPGTGPGYALVIGGMHGSELSSIEVARAVVDSLLVAERPSLNIVVIPELFPDNAALASGHPAEIGSSKNIGRYTAAFTADPNRQMPPLGSPFIAEKPVDYAGRIIEKENQAMLYLVQQLQPERIASIHAIRNVAHAGVFADPRTDGYGYALGFAADSSMAVQMAKHIHQLGGVAPGNNLDSCPSALYHSDPHVAPKGEFQKRNIHGSHSAQHKGFGVSLGGWASTAERAYEESLIPRSAAMMFTVEFPGSRRSTDYASLPEKLACKQNVRAYASAIVSVLLQQPNHQ